MVCDAVGALEAVASAAQPFELVLTDIVMPGMSGAELGRRLLEARPEQRILFMSGYDAGLLDREFPQGVDHFLSKRFTPETLAEAVDRALGGQRTLPTP